MGAVLAGRLSGRVSALENSIRLLGQIHDRLQYLQPSVFALLGGLCAMQQFTTLPFLKDCRRRMAEGTPFPESWRGALAACPGPLEQEERGVLAGLSEVLGAADLESQLAGIRYARELLEVQLEGAREYQRKHARLYRTLGVLAGLTVVIILV